MLPLTTHAISLRNSATSRCDSIQGRTPTKKTRHIPDDSSRLALKNFSDISDKSTDQTMRSTYVLAASSECVRPTNKSSCGAIEHLNHTSTAATEEFSTVLRRQTISQTSKDKAINEKSKTTESKKQQSVIEDNFLSDNNSQEPYIKKRNPNDKTIMEFKNSLQLDLIAVNAMVKSSNHKNNGNLNVPEKTLLKGNVSANLHDIAETEQIRLTPSNLDLCPVAEPTITERIGIKPSIRALIKESTNNTESVSTASVTKHEPETVQFSTQSSQERSLITQLPFSTFTESIFEGKTAFSSKWVSSSDHNNRMTKCKADLENTNPCIFLPNPKYPAPKIQIDQCTTYHTTSVSGTEISRKSAYALNDTIKKPYLNEQTRFHDKFEIGIRDDTHGTVEADEKFQKQSPNLVSLSSDIESSYNNGMDQKLSADHNDKNVIEDNYLEKEESISVIIGPTAEQSPCNDTGDETITTNDDTIVFTQDSERGTQNHIDNQNFLSPKETGAWEPPLSKATAAPVKPEEKVIKTPTKSIPKFSLVDIIPKKPLANESSGLTRKLPTNFPQTSTSFTEKRHAKKFTTKMPSFTIMTPKIMRKTDSKEKSPTKGISFTSNYKKDVTRNLAFSFLPRKIPPSKTPSFGFVTKTKENGPSMLMNESEKSAYLKSTHKLESVKFSNCQARTPEKTSSAFAVKTKSFRTEHTATTISKILTKSGNQDETLPKIGNSSDLSSVFKPIEQTRLISPHQAKCLNVQVTNQSHTNPSMSSSTATRSITLKSCLSSTKPHTKPFTISTLGIQNDFSESDEQLETRASSSTFEKIDKTRACKDISPFAHNGRSKSALLNEIIQDSQSNKRSLPSSFEHDTGIESCSTKVSKLITVINDNVSYSNASKWGSPPFMVYEDSIETINSSFNISSAEAI